MCIRDSRCTALHLAEYRSEIRPVILRGAAVELEGKRMWKKYLDLDIDLSLIHILSHAADLRQLVEGHSLFFGQRLNSELNRMGKLVAHLHLSFFLSFNSSVFKMCIRDRSSSAEGRVLLFTTKTCPNCKMAGRLLEKAGIAYELIDAQEQAQLSERFSIMQAPTLVVVDQNSNCVYKTNNVQDYITRQR